MSSELDSPSVSAGVIDDGDHDVDPPLSAAEKKVIVGAVDTLAVRHRVGYAIGLVSLIAAVSLAVYSFFELHRMATAFAGGTPPALEAFYVTVAGHAVVTIALVWLVYQVLRASERMALPRSLLNDPEVARILLGISSPHGEVAKIAKQLLSTLSKENLRH